MTSLFTTHSELSQIEAVLKEASETGPLKPQAWVMYKNSAHTSSSQSDTQLTLDSGHPAGNTDPPMPSPDLGAETAVCSVWQALTHNSCDHTQATVHQMSSQKSLFIWCLYTSHHPFDLRNNVNYKGTYVRMSVSTWCLYPSHCPSDLLTKVTVHLSNGQWLV